MTDLEAMQLHRRNLIKLLHGVENGVAKLTLGPMHLINTTEYEIAALEMEIADLNRYIVEDGGTLPD